MFRRSRSSFFSEGKRNRLRDYEQKRAGYGDSGVGEYWVIDRFGRMTTAFRSDGSRVEILADGIYRTPLLPGFELPFAQLWQSPNDGRRANRQPGR
jgi:Uma2 family endonuclease